MMWSKLREVLSPLPPERVQTKVAELERLIGISPRELVAKEANDAVRRVRRDRTIPRS